MRNLVRHRISHIKELEEAATSPHVMPGEAADTNSWTFNQNINVTTGGLSIGGTAVINSSRVVSNLAITGSGNTIDNITIDGGTF